jgi:hypothetical protein
VFPFGRKEVVHKNIIIFINGGFLPYVNSYVVGPSSFYISHLSLGCDKLASRVAICGNPP